MDRRVISLFLSLGLVLLFAGCAGKSVSSSSGDVSSEATNGEKIQPDAIKMVPPERSVEQPSGSTPSNLALAPSIEPGSRPLDDVLFDYDRFQIRKDAMPLLDANAGWLRANGGKTALIEGHCDDRGTVAYNLVLGEKRASAVKRYLVDLGVLSSQLQTTSYGETRPMCKQQTEDCYQQNRRAHFVTK